MNFNPFLATLTCCTVFLAGCNNHENQDFTSISLGEVVFSHPNDYAMRSEQVENGVIFEIEGWWGELRDGRLVVMGRDYGEVKPGDEVQFPLDESVVVNGAVRESTGTGSSAVDNEGVVYFFPGRSVSKSTHEGGDTVVTLPDGETCVLTKEGIIIDEHEFGPYASGAVVRVAADGSVAFNP